MHEYSDPCKARRLLEELRWPNGPICPRQGCNHNEVYAIKPKAGSKRPARAGLYKCAACLKQFTVTVGTIFEDSHIPLGKWLTAIALLCSSKKGVSAHQLHRMLGITYKSAWFMAHRLRFAMGPDKPLARLLKGTVEVDETYVGGKTPEGKTWDNKTPVVALIERGGEVRTRVVSSVTQKNLAQCLNECVDKSAILNTDEHAAYRITGKRFARHDRVNHSKYEYARKNADGSTAGVNYAESFFSLLKRGIVGAWHHVSPEHLPKYADEVAFRWNSRNSTDGERLKKAVAMTAGKRLSYRPLTRT
jgi:transposase-like protein